MKTLSTPLSGPHQRRAMRAQRGVVMLFGLLALAIMLIGAAAMVRSMNTSLFNAGNIGFKRDLTNQGERAAAKVMSELAAGGLDTETEREASSIALNYSATLLPTNERGIPNALLSDAAFAGVGQNTNDIEVQGVRIRYVLDRLCTTVGAADADQCVMSNDTVPRGHNDYEGRSRVEVNVDNKKGAIPGQVVYRLSVRVTGPRNTQSFFQTTLTLS